MGFTYLGPIDGHDVRELTRVLRRARALRRPVIVHAVTQKGRGYAPAEQNPERFHGVPPHRPDGAAEAPRKSNSEVFGEALERLAERDDPDRRRVCRHAERHGADTVCQAVSGPVF